MNRKTTFVLVAGILLLAFGMATMIFQNHQATRQNGVAGQNQALVQRQGAPVKGLADARFWLPTAEPIGKRSSD